MLSNTLSNGLMTMSKIKLARVTKCLLAGVCVVMVSWIASVSEWRGEDGHSEGPTTMRTIVAYSAGKQAEMDRPSPVTCDRLPTFPNIPKINRTWSPGESVESSWQQVLGTRVSLYAAFYDERSPQRYIRILATFHGRNFTTEETLFCQTRLLDPYEDNVEVVAAKPLEIWWHEWDTSTSDVDTPLLLSCPLTEPLTGSSVISVVTEPCDNPSNAFIVEPSQLNKTYERQFTICVKDMNFHKDISQNLIEWIETNKILGVDKIDVYVDQISVNSERVLSHYNDAGYVRLFHVPIKNKPGRSLWQRRRDHIVTYNDCLYRNIAESEYIVPLDIDEVVLPKIAYTWPTLMNRLKKHGWDSSKNSAILVQNVFFFDFLQGILRHQHNKSKVYIKRDDVRIQNSTDLVEIEIKDSVSSENDVVVDDNNNHDDIITFQEKYKARCGYKMPVPKLVRHIVSSAAISPIGYYSKSWMVTKKVLMAFNHYPLASIGSAGFAGWSAPFSEVQLNHYKESCNSTVVAECARYGRRARVDRAALRLRNDLSRALASSICTTKEINTT